MASKTSINLIGPRRRIYTVLRDNRKSLAVLPEDASIVTLQQGLADLAAFFTIDSYYHFIDLVKLVGSDQPVVCLVPQLPRHLAASGEYDLQDEAATHVKTILKYQPRGPYMLGGFSASGIVAYEVAHQLRAEGHEVGFLVLFDIPNPYFMCEYSMISYRLAHYQAVLRKLQWKDALGWLAGLIRRKVGARVSWRLSELSGNSLSATQMDMFAPFGPRVAAARKYRPARYAGDVLLIKRTRGLTGQYLDPQFGWGDAVGGRLEVCPIDAEHHEIFDAANDREFIARRIRNLIQRVRLRSSLVEAALVG